MSRPTLGFSATMATVIQPPSLRRLVPLVQGSPKNVGDAAGREVWQLYVRYMQRTERLFALAEYLRGRRTGVTAEALAERFGVTVRTIYRDLDALREAALPLSAERGRGGGYALDR